jgi:opacity protein-like surface antigen
MSRTVALALSLLGGAAAFDQNISIGMRAGVPITDLVAAAQSPNFGFNSSTPRYVIGPTFEVRLPFGLGFHIDALYRKTELKGTGQVTNPDGTTSTVSFSDSFGFWQFPILLKYRLGAGSFRPFVSGGPTFGRLTGIAEVGKCTITLGDSCAVETVERSRTGLALGAGLDVALPVVRLAPEIRYTHMGGAFLRSSPEGTLKSRQNQLEFLVGITF